MARKRKQRVINVPLTPPRGAKFTGEMIEYGGEQKPVFRERKPAYRRSEVVPLRDPDTGRVVHHDGPGGTKGLPVRERVVNVDPDSDEAMREFILVDLGNGTAKKEFNFREDPEKVAERQAKAERDARREALLDRLVDADPAKIAELLGEDAAKEAEARAEAAREDIPTQQPKNQFEVRPRSAPGWFDVWDNVEDEAVNERALREDDAETLVQSFRAYPAEADNEDD